MVGPHWTRETQDARTRRVVKSVITAWANRDLDATMAFFSDDAIYSVNVDGDIAPFGQRLEGAAAIRKQLQNLIEMFEFGAFLTKSLDVEADKALARIHIIYIHKASQERLNVKFQLRIELKNDRIVLLNEHHDAGYVAAFMKFAKSKARP